MKPTIGIEEEFIVVDKNYNPVNYKFDDFNEEYYSKEMHQGVLESKTDICFSLLQLKESLYKNRNNAIKELNKQNFLLMSSGTHPFADWKNIDMVMDNDIYKEVVNEYGAVARSNYIFGTHIHMGLWDENLLIPTMNKLIEYIPFFIALASNSPFWKGINSGLNSYRTQVFAKFPRTGIPDTYNSLQEYFEEIEWLFNIGCLKKKTSIWQDIRIHPYYKTIEIRCFDNQTNLEELYLLACLVYSLAFKIATNIYENNSFINKKIIQENKWKAARYGIEADFITSLNGNIKSFDNYFDDVMKDLKPIFKKLKIEEEMKYYQNNINIINGAKQQLKNYKISKELLLNNLILT